MQTFRDTTGREWTIAINALNLRNASQKHGFKIVNAVDNPPDQLSLEKLGDTDIFMDVIHSFLLPTVEIDTFLSAMDGDTFYEAGKAFYLELANFSQPQSKGLNAMRAKKAEELIRASDKVATEETSKLTSENLLAMMKSSGSLSTVLLATRDREQAT